MKTLAAAFALAFVTGCDAAPKNAAAKPSQHQQVAPNAPGSSAVGPVANGSWTQPGGDDANTRFSNLAQITVSNVQNLKVASTMSTGLLHGHEGQPLVVGSTMYVVTPWPNLLYAIDLTKPGGALKWAYAPNPSDHAVGIACCDVVNRGAVYASGKVIYNTLDNQVVAVDANTGKEAWRTRVGNIDLGETMTMAPLVVHDKVLVGNSGAELGVRGWLKALDVNSGKVVWTAYATGPDADVLIGPDFHPFYAMDKGTDLGVHTWNPDQWKIGGGTAWGWVTYDPELNLIFYGTGNPGVWNPDMRPGDNKWSMTIFARDPDTGMAKWAYQMTPHDQWDYDGVNESIPVDLPVDGKMRKLLFHADRNGFAYTLDRATGEIVKVAPFVLVNWATGIDMQTGRPKFDPSRATKEGVVTRDICPSATGGKDQQPAAYSPRTTLFYIPATNDCMDYEGLEANYIAGTPYVGASVKMFPGPGGYRGAVVAWDAVHAQKRWDVKENFPVWSGMLVTAGDVLFYGTMDGWFKAIDARDGRMLWKFKVGSGIVGNPIAYTGPDGKEYIAVYAGIGGWMGAVAFPDVSLDDPYTALGVAGAVPDLKKATAMGGMLYVFAL